MAGGPGTDGFTYWGYKPVAGPSIAFGAAFAISGLLHLYQNVIKKRTLRLGFLLPWAALVFMGGFIVREIGARGQYGNLDVYIASSVLLFCAPPIYMGANCFILGRTLYYIPWLSPMHPGRVVSTFVGLDVLIEILAANGAAISSNTENSDSRLEMGVNLVKASLLLQLVLFAMLVSVIAIFQHRCSKAGIFKRNVRTILLTLYLSCVLILIRNIFRIVEFFQGWGNGVNKHEAWFWGFEVVPMFINTTVMNVFPPASNVPSSYKIYLARDGQTELRGPGWVDKRNFILTLFDPFDIIGLIKGEDKKTMFWEEDGIEPMDLSVRHPKPTSADSV